MIEVISEGEFLALSKLKKRRVYMNENFEVINMWYINRKKCLECEACVGVCSEIAIELKNTGITYNEKLCILCGFCKKICPVGAIEVTKDD